jgi:hypothetical protein
MQMMPKISWPQRVASDANGRAEMLVAAVIAGAESSTIGVIAPGAADSGSDDVTKSSTTGLTSFTLLGRADEVIE